MISDSHICNDKDAQDNLEAPIYNTFGCGNDYHEEDSEGNQNQEFFLQMLNDLPHMIDARVPLFKIASSITRVSFD